ncbi:hypothetical protein [Agaribacterium sp. ZY112]|uniref:hypothetical protein n=1 Tax=Agaribacterium sp. ZY112 TaxID=3233574 RepID=UPI0035259413
MDSHEAENLRKNKLRIHQYMMQDIDPSEDDLGDDLEEDSVLPKGAPKKAQTTGQTAQDVANWSNFLAGQAISVTGKTATVANFAQTGNLLTAASTGTSAALAPVVMITGPIGIAMAIIDSAFSGYSAYKTQQHIRQLERIMKDLGPKAKDGTLEAIGFCIKKKNKKLKRKGFGCIPVLGSLCNSIYTTGRSIQKRVNGTRGLERRQRASELWHNTLLGDPCAIAACKELLGDKVYGLIAGMSDGHLVLKKKLRSL